MVKLKNPATKTDIQNAIFSWLDLLTEEKYTEAFDFTLHDNYYQWSPESIEDIINGYGLPFAGATFEKRLVTKWSSAFYDGSNHYKEINLFDVAIKHADVNYLIVGDVYYDLPIDGKWSDLTASFKILQSSHFTVLELNEIHVF